MAPTQVVLHRGARRQSAWKLSAGLLTALLAGVAPAVPGQPVSVQPTVADLAASQAAARPFSPPQANAASAADAAAPRQWNERPLAGRIDLGQPRVLSQRGQRLKVALPYGAAPDEPVSASRIWVVDASAPPGDGPLSAGDFVMLKPEHRNMVLLQSQHPVTASRVMLTLRVAGQDDATTYELAVPPVRFAATESETGAQTVPLATRRGTGAERRRHRAAGPAARSPR